MSQKKVREQFADTMLSIGQKDPHLIVLVGDISHFRLQPFAKACPGRYYNVGICEPTIVSMAAGLSKVGFFPVVHTIAPFIIERSFEQIKLDFCYQQLGGDLVLCGSAFDYSNLGCTHHCYGDFALIKTLPNTEIIYPATAVEFDTLFRQVYQNKHLTFIRMPEKKHNQDFRPEKIKFGKAIKVTDGKNLTIVATGPHLETAMSARDGLAQIGFDAEVIYVHTIRPLDSELICQSVAKTKRVLVVEEHMQIGGLGDDVLRATKDIPGVQFSSLAIPGQFVTEYGTYEEHCQRLGLTPDGIVRRVKEGFKI